ncbi:MAG: hypothetical protein QM500_10920 [Methylococcales bacterium]
MKDLQSKIRLAVALAIAVRTASANGSGIDLQGFNSAVVVLTPGTITDGTHTPKVQESDDDSTYTDVAATDLVGTLADLTSDTVQKVGYKGNKRYIRVVLTVAGTTTGGIYGALAVRGDADLSPVA